MGLIGDTFGEGTENSFNAVTPDIKNLSPVNVANPGNIGYQVGRSLIKTSKNVTERQAEDQTDAIKDIRDRLNRKVKDQVDQGDPFNQAFDNIAETNNNPTTTDIIKEHGDKTVKQTLDKISPVNLQEISLAGEIAHKTEDSGAVVGTVQNTGKNVKDTVDKIVKDVQEQVENATKGLPGLENISFLLSIIAVGLIGFLFLYLIQAPLKAFNTLTGD